MKFAVTFILGLIACLFLLKFTFWKESTSEIRRIVYACPEDKSSKCYKVEASYIQQCEYGECEGYYSQLFFPGGGTEYVEACEYVSDSKQMCFSTDEDKTWEIEDTGEKPKANP